MLARRPVARLLALLLVPVVILATPPVANAVTVYSNPMTKVSYASGSYWEGASLACSIDAGYKVTSGTPEVVQLYTKNWRCTAGGALGFEIDDDDTMTTIEFKGSDTVTGLDCSYGVRGSNLNGVKSGGAATGAVTQNGVGGASCAVNELCWTVEWHLHFGDDENDGACLSKSIGPIPTAVSACPHGTINAARLIKTGTDAAPGFNLKLDVVTTPTSSTSNSWAVWVYTNTTIVDGVAGFQLASGVTLIQALNYVVAPNGSWATVWNQGPIGIEIVNTHAAAQANNGSMGTNRANWDWTHIPQVTTSDDQKGMNYPPACQFWFGPKITPSGIGVDAPPLNSTGATETEPLPPTTDPTSSGCSFVLWDPTTWLSGGMCAAVGLLGAIWNTLKSLVGAVLGVGTTIAEAIAGAITGLFVPDLEHMQDSVNAAIHEWDDSPIGTVGSMVGDMGEWIAVPSGGCVGPTMHLSLPTIGAAGGTPFDFSPFEHCSGPKATLAEIVKVATTLALWIGVIWLSIRIVAAAFGIKLGGAGDDA